jgi:hypothetical protein
MEQRIIQLGRQIKKKVGTELRRVARKYLSQCNNTCVRCNREDVPRELMHVCHVGPLLADKVEEDTRQLMGEYQSSGQLNSAKTYEATLKFEEMFVKKMVDQTLVKHAEQRICTILACAKCNSKYEREDPSQIERASCWERSRYGTLVPRRDDRRSSEKSARPGDIRYFMGTRGNGGDVSDSDSPNDSGGSVSDSDDTSPSDTPLPDSPNDSDTHVVLRHTTTGPSGHKRSKPTSSAWSSESSSRKSSSKRRKKTPKPLTLDENALFEGWWSTLCNVTTIPRTYIKTMDLRVKDVKSYSNYCKAMGKTPIVRNQFVAAMKAKGHVTEGVRKMGGGVAFYDIAYVDEDCPRPRRNCRNSEDFSRNGQNLSKRLSKDKIDVEPAVTHFSTWENEHVLVCDNTTEEWGCKRPRKTRPICHEKCAKVWVSYQKFSADLDNKHRFNKSTFQNVMEERGFYRVRSEQGVPCGYEGNDWYYTNLKVTGEPL